VFYLGLFHGSLLLLSCYSRLRDDGALRVIASSLRDRISELVTIKTNTLVARDTDNGNRHEDDAWCVTSS
jgi:hypothetical protein